MVFFNDPLPVTDHELKAVRLALAARDGSVSCSRMAEARNGSGARNWDQAGYATLGRIGFEGRYDYGALGPLMNLASRLSSQAAAGQVAVGQRVFAAVEEAVESVLVGDLELKGFGRPVTAYEIRGLR